MDSFQSVAAYVVTHPWKTVLFLALGVYAIGASWKELAVVLVVAPVVAVLDTKPPRPSRDIDP